MDEQVKILRGGGVIRGDYTVVASVDGREVKRSVVRADREEVRVDCHDGRIVAMTWPTLRAAADQCDPLAPIYRRLEELAIDRMTRQEARARHAALLSRALRGDVVVYFSAEQDSTNVWWVSVVRAGNDGIAKAEPLYLRGLQVRGHRLYGGADGGTYATWREAIIEAGDIARRLRAAYPKVRAHVEGVDK